MSGPYHPANKNNNNNGTTSGQGMEMLGTPAPAVAPQQQQQQQQKQQPLQQLVSVAHQFASDDFEPNPVYNPVVAGTPATATTATTHPTTRIHVPPPGTVIHTVAPSPGPAAPSLLPPSSASQLTNNNLQPSGVVAAAQPVPARAGRTASMPSIHTTVVGQSAAAATATTGAYGAATTALHPSTQPPAHLPTHLTSTTIAAPQQTAPPAARAPPPSGYSFPPNTAPPGARITAVPTLTCVSRIAQQQQQQPQVASTTARPHAHAPVPPVGGIPPPVAAPSAASTAATGVQSLNRGPLPPPLIQNHAPLPQSQQQHPPGRLAYQRPPIPGSITFPAGPPLPAAGAAAGVTGVSLQPPRPAAAVASAGAAGVAALPPQAQAPPQGPQPQIPKPMDRRKQFLLFVKILLKHLEKNAEDRIRLAAKRVLTECIQKNRQGDPEYVPLHLAAEARILPIVGPKHWNRSVQYLNLHLKKQAEAQFAAAQQQQRQQAQAQQQHTTVAI